MKLFEKLTDSNFTLFASNHYNNPQCVDVDEFYEDLNRFKYLKRLLGRYHTYNDLQERLILNHLIVLFNVFGIEPAKKMVFFKVDKEHLSTLKTFLVFLHYVREDELIDIPLDKLVINRLRAL